MSASSSSSPSFPQCSKEKGREEKCLIKYRRPREEVRGVWSYVIHHRGEGVLLLFSHAEAVHNIHFHSPRFLFLSLYYFLLLVFSIFIATVLHSSSHSVRSISASIWQDQVFESKRQKDLVLLRVISPPGTRFCRDIRRRSRRRRQSFEFNNEAKKTTMPCIWRVWRRRRRSSISHQL